MGHNSATIGSHVSTVLKVKMRVMIALLQGHQLTQHDCTYTIITLNLTLALTLTLAQRTIPPYPIGEPFTDAFTEAPIAMPTIAMSIKHVHDSHVQDTFHYIRWVERFSVLEVYPNPNPNHN